MRLKYVGQFPEVELYDTGEWVAQGEEVDVSAELAGRPPSGEPETEGYDPGEGLLAQPANWQPADATTAEPEPDPKPKRRAPARDNAGITGGDGE